MTLEMTLLEAELLIAILTAAEDAFPVDSPEDRAMADLRSFRTRLLREYLHARIAERMTGAR